MSKNKNKEFGDIQDLSSLKRQLRLKESEVSILKDQIKALNEELAGFKTEHQNAETNLPRSKSIIDSVFNIFLDWVFVKNRNLEFVLVNPAMCKDLGLTRNELLGRSEYDLFPGDTVIEMKKLDQEVLKGKYTEVEIIKNIAGKERIFNCQRIPLFDDDGKVAYICGIGRDITQHRKIEQNYQELFQKMLDGFAVHQIICDQNGKPVDYRFLDVNPAFEKMTGFKSQEIVGKTVLEVMPNTEKIWIERYGKVALTGQPEFFEEYSASVGKYFEVTAFRPGPGQFACIFQDVTERVKARQEKRKIEAELAQAQKMESIGRLAGGVAHDFNNLIGIILGCVEMAILKKQRGGKIDTELDGIKTTAERSADLTRQLLAFARKQPISPRRIDLNSTVTGMLKMLERLIGENIEIVFKPSLEGLAIKFDTGQLNQILTNLCINASDAIEASGKITISTGLEEINFNNRSHEEIHPGNYACLEVSDTGKGIEEAALEHIFEPFFTSKKGSKGTGLGLATVYGIVKQNGGFVKVESKLEVGSTFKIFIPLCQEEKGESPLPEAESSLEAAGSGRVLLVEDDENILDLTSRILENFGYFVVASSRPLEVIENLEKNDENFDLLITDVVLPGMNGRELSEKVQQLRPGIKTLYISGYTADIISVHGINSEKNFLQKPFHMQALALAVKKVLQEK